MSASVRAGAGGGGASGAGRVRGAAADRRPLLGALPVPVDAIWGDRDRIVPPGCMDTLIALQPEAPVAIVASAGHIPMVERPDRFAWALGEVLEALSRVGNIGASGAA